MRKLAKILLVCSLTLIIFSSNSVLAHPGGGIIGPQSEIINQSESHILVSALVHPEGGIIDPQKDSINR